MAEIDPEEAQAFRARWQLVREREIAELRCTPVETKLRQLDALFASRDLFGIDPRREIEEREVRDRWDRLRRALSV